MGIGWYKKKSCLAAGCFTIVLLASLFFALQKPVTVIADDMTIKDRVFFSTVEKVLKNNHIKLGPHDKVEPALNTVIEKDCVIKVIRAFKVTVIADDSRKVIYTTPVATREAINLAGIKLNPQDIVKTTSNSKTVPNQEIEIIRVKEEVQEVEEALPYQVEKTIDNTLEKGLTKTIRPGVNGSMLNTVKITYHNGQEVKREIIDSKTIVEPIPQIVAVGNITTVSRGNENFSFNQAMYVQASAYTYTGHRTATGKQPAVGMIAVDPKVIPMGSRLYIEGYGYAVAADTGGSIKGNRIDVFLEERQQCLNWGRRTVKIYILD